MSKPPQCITLSSANIVAKLDYLVHALGRDAHELPRCPAYLSISLERRIVPCLSRQGIRRTPEFSLNSIAALTDLDENFCKTLRLLWSDR